jgi:hypothetical protein
VTGNLGGVFIVGHERVGALPRSKPWRDLLADIAVAADSPDAQASIEAVARKTLQNVTSQYSKLCDDSGVQASFTFLVALANPGFDRVQDPQADLGVNLSNDPSVLQLASALSLHVRERAQSMEYAAIATRAAGDAIAAWTAKLPGETLFGPTSAAEIWARASTAAGFSELARLYFARFTDRYLKYFLDRELSAEFSSPERRDRFGEAISRHVQGLSHHAFETAKITQSFAAGWFNKHASERMPTKRETRSFLATAFGKLAEELRREGLTDE